MTDPFKITEPQRTVLSVLADEERPLSARQVARRAWEDDPGWQRTTSGRPGFSGAKGATLPLRAGRVLRRLEGFGFVEEVDQFSKYGTRWRLTPEGSKALDILKRED